MFNTISFDLDGTLLNSKDLVDETVFKVIAKIRDKGVLTIIATGRPPRAAINIFDDKFKPDYLVCYNGGMIYKNGIIIDERHIETTVAADLINYLVTIEDIQFGVEKDDIIHVNYDMDEKYKSPNSIYCDMSTFAKDRCSKVLVFGKSKIDDEYLNKTFGDKCNILETDNGNFIEIMPKNTSKLTALEYILGLENKTIDEAIAFGDDTNDLDIIKHVGYGVAMGNAVQVVKEVAKVITSTNDQAGVYNVLKELYDSDKF